MLFRSNADYRLMQFGRKFGIVSDLPWNRFKKKQRDVAEELERLRNTRIKPGERVNEFLEKRDTSRISESTLLADLLRRPQFEYADICSLSPPTQPLGADAAEHVEAEIKYEGYVVRQQNEVGKLKRLEELPIPRDFDFEAEADVGPDDKSAIFTADLNAGETNLQTWFHLADGSTLGAYYVYIDRL